MTFSSRDMLRGVEGLGLAAPFFDPRGRPTRFAMGCAVSVMGKKKGRVRRPDQGGFFEGNLRGPGAAGTSDKGFHPRVQSGRDFPTAAILPLQNARAQQAFFDRAQRTVNDGRPPCVTA